MGRAKIPMELISNQKKRNMTYVKRKTGMIKKAKELKTLCDVNVGMIICAPDDVDHQEPAEIFPSEPEEIDGLIEKYQSLKREGKVQASGLADFFKDRKSKVEAELAKAKKRNLEAKYPTWFDVLNDLSEEQLREFAFGLGNKIDYVKAKVDSLKGSVNYQIENSIAPIGNYPVYAPPAVNDYQNQFFAHSSFNPTSTMWSDCNNVVYNNLCLDPGVYGLMNNNGNVFNDNIGLDHRMLVGQGYEPLLPPQQPPFIQYYSSEQALPASQVIMENNQMNGQRVWY